MSEQQPTPTTPQPTEQATPKRRVSRPLLIGAGAGLAVLLVGAAGLGIGLAVADDDDDRAVSLTGASSDANGDTGGGTSGSGSSGSGSGSSGSSTSGSGSAGAAASGVDASADALIDAIDRAVAAAGGAGATHVEVERGGHDVDVQLADGTDVDVFLPLEGDARVDTPDDDRDDDRLLDTATLADAIDAALAEAPRGTVREVSADDDSDRLDVHLDLDDGTDVEVTLDGSLTVVSVDHDRD
jgi:hypothetical protein